MYYFDQIVSSIPPRFRIIHPIACCCMYVSLLILHGIIVHSSNNFRNGHHPLYLYWENILNIQGNDCFGFLLQCIMHGTVTIYIVFLQYYGLSKNRKKEEGDEREKKEAKIIQYCYQYSVVIQGIIIGIQLIYHHLFD